MQPPPEVATGDAAKLIFRQGGFGDLGGLDPEHHNEEHREELKERLDRGEYWLFGEVENRLVTYTWLHTHAQATYPTLPGCTVNLREDVGYGYDAWTPPEERGKGLRRYAFWEELRVLKEQGMNWEVSFFVKHQLEGATRSLARVGIDIIPLWRVYLDRDRSLKGERLLDDDAATPAFL